LGETVVRDFSQTRVLERLMMYERRIEGSLYRTMAELRKRQGQRQSAGGGPLWDSRPRLSMEEDDHRGRRSGTPNAIHRVWEPSHVVRDTHPTDLTLDDVLAATTALEKPPQGVPANAPADPLCETKPICDTGRIGLPLPCPW